MSNSNENLARALAASAAEVNAAAPAGVVRGERDLAPYENRLGTRFFPQNARVDLLCGMYSLNHILQEEKCVFREGQPLLVLDGGGAADAAGAAGAAGAAAVAEVPNINRVMASINSQSEESKEEFRRYLQSTMPRLNPLDSNVKINLWQLCQYFPTLSSRQRRPGGFDIDLFPIVLRLLNMGHYTINYREPEQPSQREANMIEVKRVVAAMDTPFWKSTKAGKTELAAMLKRAERSSKERVNLLSSPNNGKFIAKYEAGSYAVLAKLNESLDNPELLGVVSGDTAHYSAVVKYSNCPRDMYVLIDSYTCRVEKEQTCSTRPQIMHQVARMADDNNGAAVFVYANESSYKSVAVQRRGDPSRVLPPITLSAAAELLARGHSASSVAEAARGATPSANAATLAGRVANINEKKAEKAAASTLPSALNIAKAKLVASRARLAELKAAASAEPWVCPICTLKNPSTSKKCKACGNPRPKQGGQRKTRKSNLRRLSLKAR